MILSIYVYIYNIHIYSGMHTWIFMVADYIFLPGEDFGMIFAFFPDVSVKTKLIYVSIFQPC